VADSVFGTNTDITYSVDGKLFATPNKLTVKDKNGKDITATARDYTHIRWSLKANPTRWDSAQRLINFR
jgi:hypothetical protein